VATRIEATLWRERQAIRKSVVQAWNTAALTRATKMPPLSDLLDGLEEEGAPTRSPVLQRQAWIDWAIRQGFKVVKHDKPVMFHG